jgi:H+/Cl- antiporter ClcA
MPCSVPPRSSAEGTQAPLASLVLVLTYSGVDLLVPMILATVVATADARWIDGYSIYSARLEGRWVLSARGRARAGAQRRRHGRGWGR